MNIFDMKELDKLAVDELAKAFDRISCNCLDFGGEIEYTYDPIKDSLVWREVSGEERIPRRLLREAETIYEEMVKKEKEAMKMPSTVGVVQRKNTTVVNWDDGVKTVVTLKEDDYIDQMFVGFCIAYTKRMLGSTTNILKTIEKNDTDKQNQLLKEAEKNFRKQRDLVQKEEDRIRREKKFNEMVDEEFMRMRAAKEAKARYNNYIHEHKTNKKK